VTLQAVGDYDRQLERALEGLEIEEARWMPTPVSGHILWTLWHMGRMEDMWAGTCEEKATAHGSKVVGLNALESSQNAMAAAIRLNKFEIFQTYRLRKLSVIGKRHESC